MDIFMKTSLDAEWETELMRGNPIRSQRMLLLSTVLLAAAACNSWGKVIYVDDDANGLGNGSSWQNAYEYLQDALTDANTPDKPVEVRVAQGIYRPDRSAANPEGSRDRKATFQMLSGVAIKGGFAGLGALDPNGRDVQVYETILSGDLASNDVLSEDPDDFTFDQADGYWRRPTEWCLVHESTRRENSLHVVTGSSVDQTATLDGFTITAGNAFDPPYWLADHVSFDADDRGGGVFNRRGSPTIKACTFVANSALGEGGAMHSSGECKPILMGCRFMDSYALWGAGAVCNGGIYKTEAGVQMEMIHCEFERNAVWKNPGTAMASYEATIILSDCRFAANDSNGWQGAVYNSRCNVTCVRCEFSGNRVGAMSNNACDVTLTNALFRGNSAISGGGLSLNQCNARLDNCTFLDNRANQMGGAIDNHSRLLLRNCLFAANRSNQTGGGISNSDSSLELINCTFAGNWARQVGGALLAACGTNAISTNCIFWGNRAARGPEIGLQQGYGDSRPSQVTVSYTTVKGGQEDISRDSNCTLLWGSGNMDVDPCFVEPGYWDPNGTTDDPNDDYWVQGDYHLKSQGGRWDPVTGTWVEDKITSPCIDAGDPNSPVGEEPFPNGHRINIGAYGGTVEASKSYFGGPLCETVIAGDINADCRVDVNDLLLLTTD